MKQNIDTYKLEELTDDIVIEYLYTKKGRVNSNIMRKKLPNNVIQFLTDRFSDSNSIKETLYRIYHKQFDKPRCKYCGKPLIFNGNGWTTTCNSKECRSLNHAEKFKRTSYEKYGVNNPAKSEEVKNKTKQTCLEKYGVEYSFQSKEVKNKTKQTCLEKYGVEHASQAEIVKNKSKQTCLEKYGVEYSFQSENNKEKSKITWLDKYNVDNPWKSKEIQEKIFKTKRERYGDNLEDITTKIKQTCFVRYGYDSYFNTNEYKIFMNNLFENNIIQEKIRTTCLNKYGVNWYAKTSECQQKVKNTSLERYGVEYYSQTDEYGRKVKNTSLERYGVKNYSQTEECKQKVKNTSLERYGVENYSQTEECKQKVKNTSLERYGVENYSQTEECKQKVFNTKKKNNTFNTSSIEIKLCEYLTENNYNYIYQYISAKYPFNCDFYFPDYDLYVEIQGSWTHGGHPYNEEFDSLQLQQWKSKNTKYYDNAIYTWTISDVNKRTIAKQNNLNYLEIFSIDLDYCINNITKQMNKTSSEQQK